jgi:hypothetical protein
MTFAGGAAVFAILLVVLTSPGADGPEKSDAAQMTRFAPARFNFSSDFASSTRATINTFGFSKWALSVVNGRAQQFRDSMNVFGILNVLL